VVKLAKSPLDYFLNQAENFLQNNSWPDYCFFSVSTHKRWPVPRLSRPRIEQDHLCNVGTPDTRHSDLEVEAEQQYIYSFADIENPIVGTNFPGKIRPLLGK
jgi:hypothetical protein